MTVTEEIAEIGRLVADTRVSSEAIGIRIRNVWPALTAALSDMVGGWQDIATAPKDGTWILGFESRIGMNTKYTPHEVMRYVDFGHSDSGPHWRNSMGNICEPTHWQPLPAPPPSSPVGGKEP